MDTFFSAQTFGLLFNDRLSAVLKVPLLSTSLRSHLNAKILEQKTHEHLHWVQRILDALGDEAPVRQVTSPSRVEKFDSSGNMLLQWGSWGSKDGQFLHVTGVAVDNQGNVYVGDNEGNQIEKFDTNGDFFGKWGSQGRGEGQFDYVGFITVDLETNIYVSSDGGSDRVQKFRPR